MAEETDQTAEAEGVDWEEGVVEPSGIKQTVVPMAFIESLHPGDGGFGMTMLARDVPRRRTVMQAHAVERVQIIEMYLRSACLMLSQGGGEADILARQTFPKFLRRLAEAYEEMNADFVKNRAADADAAGPYVELRWADDFRREVGAEEATRILIDGYVAFAAAREEADEKARASEECQCPLCTERRARAKADRPLH